MEKESIVNVDGYAHYSKSGSDPIRIGETTFISKIFSITLGNQKRDWEIRFKYKGDTPIRSGDHVTAGIIVNDDGIVSLKQLILFGIFQTLMVVPITGEDLEMV